MNNQFWTVIRCLALTIILTGGIGVNVLCLIKAIKEKDKVGVGCFLIILTIAWILMSYLIYLTTLTPKTSWV